MVVAFDSAFSPLALKRWLRELEYACGRSRDQSRFSNRTLDMDILLAGDVIMHSEKLRLPRPELTKRAYVLKPIFDLAPDLTHPENSQTIKTLWQHLDQPAVDSLKKLDSDDWFK